jgi:hypothetical protein
VEFLIEVRSTVESVHYIGECVSQNIPMQGENLPIDVKLMHSIGFQIQNLPYRKLF